jgi:heptosyltransferase I
MSIALASPPGSICILRLSAIGDVCHALPIVRTLQSHWPDTRLTWVIGKTEASLVGDIPGVEFIIFDKATGWRGYRELRTRMQARHFDVLLIMQVSLRANVASLFIPASIRLGFDRIREYMCSIVSSSFSRPSVLLSVCCAGTFRYPTPRGPFARNMCQSIGAFS